MRPTERRSGKQLRSGLDRRSINNPNFKGPERRNGLERRCGKERRILSGRDPRIAYVL